MAEISGDFIKHSGHFYTVRNQNGFNNALYDFFNAGKEMSYSKEEVRKMVQNFPLVYPASIIIVDQSFECSRVYIEHVDIDYIAHSWPSWYHNPDNPKF